MLDHRQIRENPTLIKQGLNRRGLKIDLEPINKQISKLKEIEQKLNSLQAQSNEIGKEVGLKIKNGSNSNSKEINVLRKKGSEIKQEANEIDDRNGGITIFTSTDQTGNFRIGDGVVINQQDGTITGDAYTKSLFSTMTPFILALGGD